MKDFILLLRPHQWIKNGFVFLPLFFSGQILHYDYFLATVVAFFAFSFMASSIYCFNDIWDVEADRRHAKKRFRPIASGRVSKNMGYCLMGVMAVLSILLTCIYFPQALFYKVAGVLLTYFIMNVVYCIKLKNVAIVDVFIIATGFVLRVLLGGLVTGIWISHWIILMTFLLALFLAFAKRRDDVVAFEETGVVLRKNVSRYNLAFINQVITILATIIMVCYIMYTVSEEVVSRMGTPYLYVTSVFVLAGLIRYLQLTIVDVKSGSPTRLLMHDLFIQLCVVGWILSFFVIIYI